MVKYTNFNNSTSNIMDFNVECIQICHFLIAGVAYIKGVSRKWCLYLANSKTKPKPDFSETFSLFVRCCYVFLNLLNFMFESVNVITPNSQACCCLHESNLVQLFQALSNFCIGGFLLAFRQRFLDFLCKKRNIRQKLELCCNLS